MQIKSEPTGIISNLDIKKTRPAIFDVAGLIKNVFCEVSNTCSSHSLSRCLTTCSDA